jgi:hypothetical protein
LLNHICLSWKPTCCPCLCWEHIFHSWLDWILTYCFWRIDVPYNITKFSVVITVNIYPLNLNINHTWISQCLNYLPWNLPPLIEVIWSSGWLAEVVLTFAIIKHSWPFW